MKEILDTTLVAPYPKESELFKEHIQEDLLLTFVYADKKEIMESKGAIEKYLEDIHVTKKNNFNYHKMLYNIFVELLENIYKHNKISPSHNAAFSLAQDEKNFILEVTSFCEDNDFQRLHQILSYNPLSTEEIKNLYREKLNDGEGFSNRGGAGLGNLTIAHLIKKHFPGSHDIFSLTKTTTENELIKAHLTIKVPKPADFL